MSETLYFTGQVNSGLSFTGSGTANQLVATGSVAVAGPQGPTGPQGPQGVPGTSGGGTWGSITGTLSNQTDLNTALNTKAATTYVDTQDALKAPALNPTAVKIASYTAAANEFVPVDTTAGAVTITLPTAPANGTRFGVKMVIQGGTNTVTVTRGGTDVFNKVGGNTSVTVSLLNQGVQFQYNNGIWYGVAADLGLTALDARYQAAGTAGVDTTAIHQTRNETAAGEKTFTSLQHDTVGDIDLNGMTIYKPSAQKNWFVQDTVIQNFQSGHGWIKQSVAGTQTDDTTNYIKGSQSLKLTTDGLGTSIFTRSAVLSPTIDLTGKQLKLWFYIDRPDLITTLRLEFTSDAFSSSWYNWFVSSDMSQVKANTWVPLTFTFGRGCTLNGTPTRSAINKIQFLVNDNNTGTPVNINFGGIASFDEPREGVVSITFDDGWDNQYTTARPKMDQYNFKGTAYIITDSLHHDTTGYMTTDQMKALQYSGWDISCHTNTHPFLSQLTAAQIEAEFYTSKNWLLKNGFTKGADDMALPHGDYDETTVLPIARKYFRSIRTTATAAETLPAASLVKLRTYLVTNLTTTSLLQTAIDNAKANKEWLIITFHKIVTSPTIDTEFSTANFNTIIDYLANSGVAVRTVSEVLNNYIYPDKDKLNYVAPGASGNVLTSDGTSWTSQASGGGVTLASTIPSADSTAAASAGSAGTAARSDHSHPVYTFQATDCGFKGWSYDPAMAVNSSIMGTAGLVYAVKIPVPVATTMTNLYIYITTAGATLTASQCIAGLYQNGTLLASTADQSTAWASTGLKTMALTGAPISVAAGNIYVAFYANGATLPTLARSAGFSALNNAGLLAATSRFATADSARTTTLAATLGTLSASALSYWAAVA